MELVHQGVYGVSEKSLPVFRVSEDRNAASVWILRGENLFIACSYFHSYYGGECLSHRTSLFVTPSKSDLSRS